MYQSAMCLHVQIREKERKTAAAERKARLAEAAKLEAAEEIKQAAAEAQAISKQCAPYFFPSIFAFSRYVISSYQS